MGSINNTNEKFVEINITLEDLFNSDGNSIRFAIASLAIWYLRRAAPEIADSIGGDINTITDWYLKDGELVVLIGKDGYDRPQLESDIASRKKLFWKKGS